MHTRVSVIGASGFIGLRLTEMLTERAEFSVTPIVRQPSSLAVLARQPLDWKITSFIDPKPLAAALAGTSVCIHAAIGDSAQIVRMAAATYRACVRAGVRRLIWLSSASVHGQNCAAGTDESSPLHDRHPLTYTNAKVRAEWCLEKLARDGRVNVVMLRPGIVFGPRSRWITDAAAQIRAGRAGWVEHGQGICNSIYVDNLVQAIRLATVVPGLDTGPLLVGDAETVTWRDFLLPIAQHLGRDESCFAEVTATTVSPERENRIAQLTMHPAWARVGPLVPGRVKRLAKAALGGWRTPPVVEKSWVPVSVTPKAQLTPELTLLEQCHWKLPHARAHAVLGYVPGVTFATGMRRSLAWLDFAEGRA